jgi:hypothetical protein
VRQAGVGYRVCWELRDENGVARRREHEPGLRIGTVRDGLGPYRPQDLAKYEAGLRKAGLPE